MKHIPGALNELHQQSTYLYLITDGTHSDQTHCVVHSQAHCTVGSLWFTSCQDTPSYRNVLIGGAAIRKPWP